MRRTTFVALVAHFFLLSVILRSRAWAEDPPPEIKTVKFFVATTGNDANPGTEEKPVATLTKAQELARKAAAVGDRQTWIEVIIRGGKYELATPLHLTHEDLGKCFALHYWGAPQEDVVLSGGREIRGWRAVDGVWQAELPEVKAGKWNFVDLYVGEARRPRARRPNEGFLRIERAGADKRTSFFYRPVEVKAWANPGAAEVVFLHDWSTSRVRVKGIDEAARQLVFADPIGASAPHYAIDSFEPHPRYFLEGAREFLDAPGEWHLDTATGVLRYVPMSDEKIESFVAIAPRLENLITIQGDDNRRIETISLKDLTLAHCGWLPPKRGFAGSQACFYEDRDGARQSPAQANTAAAIKIDHAKRIVINNCRIVHHGGCGIWIERRCDTCIVNQSVVDDLGGNGIMLGETASRSGDKVTQYAIVSQSQVRRCGQRYFGAVGIWLGLVAHCAVEQCEVSDLPYTGISVGWKWSTEPTACSENTIANNHIHHCMQVLSDGGGIYTLGRQPGTVISENHIHDIPVNAGRAESNGMFLDEGSSEFVVEGNTVYNIAKSPIRFHQATRLTLKNNRLVAAPGVPTFRYNSADSKTMTFEKNEEIVAEKYTLPESDPAWKAGPGKKEE